MHFASKDMPFFSRTHQQFFFSFKMSKLSIRPIDITKMHYLSSFNFTWFIKKRWHI